jgi:virulence factor Mce-like protein
VRRLLAAAMAFAALAGAVLLATGCGGGKTSGYRIDAIFDSAGFLTPDTDVRVGGAKVGKVTDLTLTRDHKARVEMDIDKRFAPFRADADCNIQPQSLISEKFVECMPGTPDAAALPASGGTTLLPVRNTHSPIDIDLLLNIFDRPVRERLTLLVSALGTGLAARGDDLNATIRRAAPALQETRRVLRVLDQDRTQLQQLIADSDTVLSSLAAGRGKVAEFVRGAGDVAAVSGARRERLAAAIHELPAMLTQARGGLGQLTQFAAVGTPFAKRLRASGPGLNRLVRELAPFAKELTPTLERLGTTARRAKPALKDIAPQAKRLNAFAKDAPAAVNLFDQLGISVRDNGVIEGLGNLGYYGATALARFDQNGHMLPAYLINSLCAINATAPTPDCDAHFKASDKQRAAYWRALERERAARKQDAKKKQTTKKPAADKPKLLPELPKKIGDIPLPDLPKVINDVLGTLKDTVGGLLNPKKEQQPKQSSANPLQDLLDYILR